MSTDRQCIQAAAEGRRSEDFKDVGLVIVTLREKPLLSVGCRCHGQQITVAWLTRRRITFKMVGVCSNAKNVNEQVAAL